MRRNVIAAILVAAAACMLSACGSSSSSSSTAASTTAAASNGASSAACKAAHKVTTVTPGQLTVAAYEAPPYIGVTGSTPTGADGEILAKIAAMECLKVHAMDLQIAGVIPAITTGRADVAAGDWYATTLRAKQVGQPGPAYLDQMAIVSKNGLKTIEQLAGKRVGTLQGDLWDTQLGKAVGSGFKLYQTEQGAYLDLKDGRLDAVVDTYVSSGAELKLTPVAGAKAYVPPADPAVGASAKPAQNAYPTNIHNTALVAAINADLATLRASGALKQILVANGFPASALNTGPRYFLSS